MTIYKMCISHQTSRGGMENHSSRTDKALGNGLESSQGCKNPNLSETTYKSQKNHENTIALMMILMEYYYIIIIYFHVFSRVTKVPCKK